MAHFLELPEDEGGVTCMLDNEFLCLFQGQFLLDNFIDKSKLYEFPVELMVRIFLLSVLVVV